MIYLDVIHLNEDHLAFILLPKCFKELTELLFEGLQSDEILILFILDEILIWIEVFKQYNEILGRVGLGFFCFGLGVVCLFICLFLLT